METLIEPSFYRDEKLFQRENRELFLDFWCFACFKSDLSKDGDYITRRIGGKPLFIRNFKGKYRAFENICSHRFSRIFTTECGNGPVVCPYHGWRYDEEGLPSVIPKKPRFADLDANRIGGLGLKEWNVETSGEFVFVHHNKERLGLHDFLGETYYVLEEMSQAMGDIIDTNSLDIATNWKVAVENTLESYHVGSVHPESFAKLNLQSGTFEYNTPHSSWTTNLSGNQAQRIEKMVPAMRHRPLKVPGYFHQFIFPNLTIATTLGMSFSVQYFHPAACDRTGFTSFVFGTNIEVPQTANSRELIGFYDSVVEFNRKVFTEDKVICEVVQDGIRDADFQVGQVSEEEMRVLDFQKQYRKALII